ncbi:hypothetical protein VSDG_05050 [Cytospora chrysosperma]|uniref:Cytochrome P450 n=1 Tax=Cytospora chrysosperma TaxID=252740 RepID=A0A423VYI5_CYTCH|nr:hypothetical protein VSDG_05050 [Valsa sordida]
MASSWTMVSPLLAGSLPARSLLESPSLWIIAAGGLLIAAFIRSVYLAFLHPLSKYPGPKTWAISRIPWAYHVIKGDLWQLLDNMHDEYGSVVRIAPDEVTYVAPHAWKEIYAAKPQLLKDPQSMTPPLNGSDSLFTAIGDNHRRIRGAFVNAFSDRALREQSSIVEDYVGQFISRLKGEIASQKNHVIDIQQIVGYCMFDIISDLTWGESPRALQTFGDLDWYNRFFLHAQFSTIRNCLSRFSPLEHILHYFFLGITSKQRLANTKLTNERIDRRLAARDSRSDFMTPLVGKISEDSNKGITKSEVLTNGLAVVIANSQLSTIAITTACYFLMRQPQTFQTLAEEVRGHFQDEAGITVASTTSLPYLNAVINETLRLHHPTPGSMPRITPKEGMLIGGQFIPGGMVVGVTLRNIHLRPENFNKPFEFHPERFLEPSDPRYDRRFEGDHLEAFQPFSMGPRICIGNKVFLAEARTLMARLVWNFNMDLVEPDAGKWLEQRAWLVYEPKPLRTKLFLRL